MRLGKSTGGQQTAKYCPDNRPIPAGRDKKGTTEKEHRVNSPLTRSRSTRSSAPTALDYPGAQSLKPRGQSPSTGASSSGSTIPGWRRRPAPRMRFARPPDVQVTIMPPRTGCGRRNRSAQGALGPLADPGRDDHRPRCRAHSGQWTQRPAADLVDPAVQPIAERPATSSAGADRSGRGPTTFTGDPAAALRVRIGLEHGPGRVGHGGGLSGCHGQPDRAPPDRSFLRVHSWSANLAHDRDEPFYPHGPAVPEAVIYGLT